MNAQHSAESGEWYSNDGWMEPCREVLEFIEFDPCSCAQANKVVRAANFSGEGLVLPSWYELYQTAYVNPPGTCRREQGELFSVCKNVKRCSCGLPKQFLERCIEEAAAGMRIIYLAYSVNQIRQLSNIECSDVEVTIAYPGDRIPYLDPTTLEPVKGTNCDSAFIYLQPRGSFNTEFVEVFAKMGCAIYGRID